GDEPDGRAVEERGQAIAQQPPAQPLKQKRCAAGGGGMEHGKPQANHAPLAISFSLRASSVRIRKTSSSEPSRAAWARKLFRVPQQINRPCSTIPMRPANFSATSSECVDRNTVVP